jgi:hypothetical protein
VLITLFVQFLILYKKCYYHNLWKCIVDKLFASLKCKKCELKMEITDDIWIFINYGNNTFYTVFNSLQKVLLP